MDAGFASNSEEGSANTSFVFGVGPGASYFLNEHVAVEALLLYKGAIGSHINYFSNIAFNVGFQVYLHHK